MPLVVADAGPLHYLVLTGDIELLPKLFERVLVPQVVRMLASRSAAGRARWIALRQAGWTCGRSSGRRRYCHGELDQGSVRDCARAGRQGRAGAMDDRVGRGTRTRLQSLANWAFRH